MPTLRSGVLPVKPDPVAPVNPEPFVPVVSVVSRPSVLVLGSLGNGLFKSGELPYPAVPLVG